jgi:hypothetical protein
MLSFELTRSQLDLLHALKFWAVEMAYLNEREPENEADKKRAHDTIIFNFECLDRAGVPFWVQNVVVCEYQHDYKKSYTSNLMQLLESNNITVKGA